MATLEKGLLVKTRPEKVEDLHNGQGTIFYNHNIEEVLVKENEHGGVEIVDNKAESTGTMYQYDRLRVEYPKTADNIFGTLLTAKYPANTESKLVNEFQSRQLGLIEPVEGKDPYLAFLEDRLALRQMVDADCNELNIPNDL